MHIWILWPALAALVRVPMDGPGFHWRLVLGSFEGDVYRSAWGWRFRVFAGLGAWDAWVQCYRGWSLAVDVGQGSTFHWRIGRDCGFNRWFMRRLVAAGF